MKRPVDKNLLRQYAVAKESLGLGSRYLEAFELRNGLSDGKFYSQKEAGEKLGISPTRIWQMEARVINAVQNYFEKSDR